MNDLADPVTVSVSRGLLSDIMHLSEALTDRMHQLLERDTDGNLGKLEKVELEALVRMAEFGQVVSMALQQAARS